MIARHWNPAVGKARSLSDRGDKLEAREKHDKWTEPRWGRTADTSQKRICSSVPMNLCSHEPSLKCLYVVPSTRNSNSPSNKNKNIAIDLKTLKLAILGFPCPIGSIVAHNHWAGMSMHTAGRHQNTLVPVKVPWGTRVWWGRWLGTCEAQYAKNVKKCHPLMHSRWLWTFFLLLYGTQRMVYKGITEGLESQATPISWLISLVMGGVHCTTQ